MFIVVWIDPSIATCNLRKIGLAKKNKEKGKLRLHCEVAVALGYYNRRLPTGSTAP